MDEVNFVWMRISTGQLFLADADEEYFEKMLAIHEDVGASYDFEFLGAL